MCYLGKEYSFGDGGGVIATKPKDISGVTFRETIFMGYTFLTPNEIHDVITNLKKTFRGDSYHLLNQYVCLLIMTYSNCNTFSNEFCKIIVGKEIPKHINRCANVANWFSGIGTRISKFVDDMDIKLPVFNEEPKTKLDVC